MKTTNTIPLPPMNGDLPKRLTAALSSILGTVKFSRADERNVRRILFKAGDEIGMKKPAEIVWLACVVARALYGIPGPDYGNMPARPDDELKALFNQGAAEMTASGDLETSANN